MAVPDNLLKAKLKRNEKCFGMWLHSGSATIAEIIGQVGLDFLIIDQEHGPGELDNLVSIMRAMAGSLTTPVLRVPSSDPAYLKRVVDAGVQAIVIPMVDSADEAKMVVDACLYPPHGKRGNATGVIRASRYGLAGNYLEIAHEQMLVIPQVETGIAVENAGAIASVPGVDAVFIGPADLSGSIGLPGQTGAKEVEALIATAFDAIRESGKPVATVPRDGRSWEALFDDGYQMVATGSDLAHMRDAALAQATMWAERANSRMWS